MEAVVVPAETFARMLRVLRYVSLGRGYTGTGVPYPDAAARRALGELDALGLDTIAMAEETLLQSIRARHYAKAAHEGQTDKVGEDYIKHPARVAAQIRAAGYSDEVEAVAWLHDVVEDTPVTLEVLREAGFTETVVEAVDAISKRQGEKFSDYYERVKANPVALVVKWHDVADNADPARLAKVAPDTRERLRAKYERAREILGGLA